MEYSQLKEAFKEVEDGLSPQAAVSEAARCIKCQDAPCTAACPAHIDIPKFIRQIATRNFRGAIKVIKEDNILAGTCARICPQSQLCEAACSACELAAPIQIGRLQRFAADQEAIAGPKPLKSLPDKKVSMAVIGSGPAGLAAAAFLKRLGYGVDLYESASYPGGVLSLGIPAYRLPKAVVAQETAYIESLGVKLFKGKEVTDPAALLERYCAVFIGAGVSRPVAPNIEGETFEGVIQAATLLKKVNLTLIEETDFDLNLGRKVLVIGGGNAAMDAAVTARRLGAEDVTVLYRRTEAEMPAWEEERNFALSQGVVFQFLRAPVRFGGTGGRLNGVECIQMKLGEADGSGRRRPVPVAGSEYRIPCDSVILALGQAPGDGFTALKKDAHGLVEVDPKTLMTSIPGIFAGGDMIRGSDMAVKAVADGKQAAFAMDTCCAKNLH